MREVKNHLYEQVARLGKAMAHPKRLELIELLCQGEKTVEALAAQSDISVQLASAHLKTLRQARLVEARKDGKYVLYRLSSTSVADLWVVLRSEAEARLVELQRALAQVVAFCRGPFCLMAPQAVELLRQHGHHAFHLRDGVAEWRARGLPVHAAA